MIDLLTCCFSTFCTIARAVLEETDAKFRAPIGVWVVSEKKITDSSQYVLMLHVGCNIVAGQRANQHMEITSSSIS